MDDDLPLPTEDLIRRVFQLTCTPFRLAAWGERWSEYGWSHDPSPSDKFGITVGLPEGWILLVSPIADGSIEGCLPLHYWEEFDPELHRDPEEYSRQKKAFDTRFEAAAELALRHLPEPFLRWTDADQTAHRAIAWEGTEGILILQQASRDPQFGIEVDFWLARCKKSEFRPRTPLIDWLMQRS
jgi:hypothetical protein